MSDLSKRIALPPPDSFNSGLTVPTPAQMLSVFGRPGRLTDNCSEPSAAFRSKVVTADVGPFRVTGHRVAVLSLTHVFEDVKAAGRQDILDQIKTEGMLCVRKIRGGTNYSNHSWGCAIDNRFGELIELGSHETCQGLLDLYPFLHARKWVSGMGYHHRPDSMHAEPSWELIQLWKTLGLL